jgi:signal transduction histidine kinase
MILQVAVPNRFVRENSVQVLNIFSISVPIVLLISAILGYSYSSLGLSPIRRLVDRLRAIGARDLRQRLSLPQSKDELYDLSESVNSLLERLEKAFRSQETFVSDASHQLKTPLAILKAELELLGREVRGEDNAHRVESLREEVEALISLVSNLLLLARVDAGEDQLVLSEVELDEVVTTAVERLTHLAKSKGIRLKLNFGSGLDVYSVSFKVRGDVDLLVSLFQSLLENAIKYSPTSSEVAIELKNQGSFLTVDIMDQGPGIAEYDMPRAFERFHRIASPQAPSGSGLGLSIARRIADLHRASLELKNRPEGGLAAHFEIKTF